jgi:hypothetical protein
MQRRLSGGLVRHWWFESLVRDWHGWMTMVVEPVATEDRIDGRGAVHGHPKCHWSPLVTTAFHTDAQSSSSGASRPANTAAIVILGGALIGFFLLAGTTFAALAIAFPIALTVAQALPVYVSQSDIAIATQLGTLWPLFIVAAVASFVAALATLVKLIQRVSPATAA